MPLSPPRAQALAAYLDMPPSVSAGRARPSRWLFPSRGRDGPSDPAALRPAAEGAGAGRRPRPGAAVAACAAPCLRQPSARPRRRSAQRAADARPRRYRDDADLYPCAERAAAPAGRDRAPAGAPQIARLKVMRHFLDFERPIAELEGKIEELRHLSTDSGLNIAEEVGRLEAQAEPAAAPDLCAADAVAEGAGRAPPRAAALPRLHRRADRRFRAARRRPRLCRGCRDDRRHRPVSRPQRRGARHREGRRHRGPASSTISAWRGPRAIARRGG